MLLEGGERAKKFPTCFPLIMVDPVRALLVA